MDVSAAAADALARDAGCSAPMKNSRGRAIDARWARAPANGARSELMPSLRVRRRCRRRRHWSLAGVMGKEGKRRGRQKFLQLRQRAFVVDAGGCRYKLVGSESQIAAVSASVFVLFNSPARSVSK